MREKSDTNKYLDEFNEEFLSEMRVKVEENSEKNDTLGRFAPTSPLPLLGIGFANTCAASATSLIPTKCMKFVPQFFLNIFY